MGHWRFQKRFGNKFVRLNISKTGFSVTGGVPGAHVNADLSNRRKKMFMNTFSLPGSGLSYRTSGYGPERNSRSRADTVLVIIGLVILAVLLFGG
jgi:hypothetical protein